MLAGDDVESTIPQTGSWNLAPTSDWRLKKGRRAPTVSVHGYARANALPIFHLLEARARTSRCSRSACRDMHTPTWLPVRPSRPYASKVGAATSRSAVLVEAIVTCRKYARRCRAKRLAGGGSSPCRTLTPEIRYRRRCGSSLSPRRAPVLRRQPRQRTRCTAA